MNNSHSEAYAAAGVDITAGYKSVELMKKHIRKTEIPGVCSDVGGFGGLFIPDLAGMQEPVLVSGTDGVGTKLKIAFLMNKHDTIGIDCVAPAERTYPRSSSRSSRACAKAACRPAAP